jgi:hypothetical protein
MKKNLFLLLLFYCDLYIYILLDFIIGLEKDYPSTVSTIVKTAAKLTPSNSIDPECRCVICFM